MDPVAAKNISEVFFVSQREPITLPSIQRRECQSYYSIPLYLHADSLLLPFGGI